MIAGTLYLFHSYMLKGVLVAGEIDMAKIWTISLTTMAVFQWMNAWNCRSEHKSIFQTNPFSNKFLVGATVIVAGLQLFAVYSPMMNKFLHTAPLLLSEWLTIIALSTSIIFFEETRKFFYRRKIMLSYEL